MSKTGAPSTALGPDPGSCTLTDLEVAFRTIDAISKEGENSTVAIWNGAVTCTEACPCCEGVNCTGAASAPETSWSAAILKLGELITPGRCCCEGVNRIVPM